MTMTRSRPRVVVRRSPVHGRGLFANRDLTAGQRLLEYRGRVMTWDEANISQDERDADQQGVTYLFDLDDGTVIDGSLEGNSARFLNHSCEPNCEAENEDGRIWIHTLTSLPEGAELTIDYALVVDDPDDPDVRAMYACRCGSRACRRTMLAPAG